MDEIKKELAQYAIDLMKDGIGENEDGCDIHHHLFNSDYFIIGTHEAKVWIEKNIGVFEAINLIVDYEKAHFGDVTTDLTSPEAVANMVAYIVGEEVLSESETLKEGWDVALKCNEIQCIIAELEEAWLAE